jgi:hypothetical protein
MLQLAVIVLSVVPQVSTVTVSKGEYASNFALSPFALAFALLCLLCFALRSLCACVCIVVHLCSTMLTLAECCACIT